jgi:Tol biopolymer transport system component
MAPSPGTRLGSYEILSAIGSGGMGEVYRALDTKLNREVALKVLPDAFAQDPDRLARFKREAQVLASLDHPNIGAIYGFEDADGIHALVLQLVEGPTLADRVTQGPIPIDEALPIARQIADALDAAHNKGVIHRDLKPANIKLRPDGTVKVLDFGLAKLLDTETTAGQTRGYNQGLTNSPTITTPAMTMGGVILGTAAYMSPEQARGKAADKRADIWAFGCVLFEMLTGTRAFAGATLSDTIAAILERDPSWERLPESTPPPIRRLLRRCLQKDREDRLHDIADARIEIVELIQGISDGSPAATSDASRGSMVRLAFVAGATIIAVGAFGWALRRSSETTTDAAPAATLTRLTYDSGVTSMPALSPDGRLLAYSSDRAGRGDRDIWIQQTDGGVPLRLTDDSADDTQPDFSPDGREIVFRSERGGGGIFVVSALGGPARLIVAGGRQPRFSPDGSRIAYTLGQFRGTPSSTQSALNVLSLAGGAPTRLLPDFVAVFAPVWSPDGHSLLAIARHDVASPLSESLDWWWVPIDGRQPVRTGVLDQAGLRAAEVAPHAWISDGVLFSDGQNLTSVSVSQTTGRANGPARLLTVGSGSYEEPATSKDGAIVFAALTRERVIARAALGDVSSPVPPVRLHADGQDGAYRASITRDGATIAFERHIQRQWEIWIKKLSTGEQHLLIRVDAPTSVNATLSSDGSRVAYTISETTGLSGRGYVLSTSGGTPQQVCEQCVLYGFISDNRRVLAQADGLHALRLYDVNGSYEDLVTSAEGILNRPHVSPDDKWLAFRRTVNAANRNYVVPFIPGHSPPDHLWTLIDEPTTTGRPAGWSLDGTILYLLLDADGFRCLWGQRIDRTSGRPLGTPFPVRHFHGSQVATADGVSSTYGNAMSAAGFIYESIDTRSDIWKLSRTAVRK